MTAQTKTPVPVANMSDGLSVSLGSYHGCALRAAGGVDCWGIGSDGQIGNGALDNTSEAVHVSGLSDAVAVAAGSDHVCALRAGGSVVCWGYGNYGELGNGGTASVEHSGRRERRDDRDRDRSRLRSRLRAAHAAEASRAGVTASTASSATATAATRPRRSLVSGLSDATALAAGAAHVCALRSNGQIACWGSDASGQLGDGSSATPSPTPVAVSGISTAIAIASGNSTTCAVLSGGSVQCWGDNMRARSATATRRCSARRFRCRT